VRLDRAVGIVTAAATSQCPELIFANEFVEILKEADKDHKQRTGEPDQKQPGQHVHSGKGQGEHSVILDQAGPGRGPVAFTSLYFVSRWLGALFQLLLRSHKPLGIGVVA